MPSLTLDIDAAAFDAAAFDAATRLSGETNPEMTPLARAGNNRVYRVRTTTSTYALKAYAGGATGTQRLRREYDALSLLNPCGTARDVPRPVAVDRLLSYALYDWIDGNAVSAHDESDIAAALAFMRRTHTLRASADAQTLLGAAEACMSASELSKNLERRLERLRAATADDAGAAAFVTGELSAALHRQTARLKASQESFATELPKSARTLSPSDFSFHNALRRADGTLVFLDFEYFGWDDPVKLVSDFLWHPAMCLSLAQAMKFQTEATLLYAAFDKQFERRFAAYFPLFGLKWCMIVLNEFLADDWNRRRFAGQQRSHADVKAAQLDKARRIFTDVNAVMNVGDA